MNRIKYPAGRRMLKVAMTAIVFFLLQGLAQAQVSSAGTGPAYVNNQLILQFAPGTTQDVIATKAQQLGMRVVKKVELPDTYLLERLPTRAELSIESIKTRAASDMSVLSVQFNNISHLCRVPNDPMWSSLWGMVSIRAPQAWDTQLGSQNVVVAVLDSGVYLAHEDLQGRLLPGKDIAGAKMSDPNDADDDPNPSTDDKYDPGAATHGTHVSGTIAAQGNNSKGVVGVCWDGVKIVPVKACADDAYQGNLTSVDIVAGLDYILKYSYNGKGVDVVNMSIGGPSADDAEHRKIQELAAAGIVLVAAAGNDGAMAVSYPAAFEECIAVSAVRKDDDLTGYSNWGPEIDVAAPGGDGGENDILSTTWTLANGPGYGYLAGTSMATPHVTGAVALLISHGVPKSEVKKRLQDSARTPNIGGFIDKRKFGAGIVDLSKAMKPPAGTIEILQPKNAAALESYNVRFVIRLNKVKRDSVKIWIDFEDKNPADGVPDSSSSGLPTETLTGMDPRISYDSVTGTMTFDYEVNRDSGGAENPNPTYNIYVWGLQELGPIAEASAIFFVKPKTIQQGRLLFTMPYTLSGDTLPESIIKSDSFTLSRWDPVGGSDNKGGYVTYTSGSGSVDWQNFVAHAWVRPHGTTEDIKPTGLGYWLDLSSSTPLVPEGINSISDKACDIELFHPAGSSGWNMIGNPFPFNVNWGLVTFTYQGSTLTMDEAVKAKWISPYLYQYINGQYQVATTPQGVLAPWQGYWVRSLVGDLQVDPVDLSVIKKSPLVMSIPPLQAPDVSSSTATSRAIGVSDGWTIRLKASAGSAVDSYNFAGVSTRSADGYDVYDGQEPPQVNGDLNLSFMHKDWGENSGGYAVDLKTGIGTGKTWDFEVNTTMTGKDVQISWPSLDALPKQYKATLEDLDSGSKVYMATRSSYTYNSGTNGGVRHFRLSVTPENKGRLLVTGVNVTRNRGAGVTIAYSVSRDARIEVKLRNGGSSKLIRTLGSNTTRAAGLSSVVWDGVMPDGNPAPSGLYICEIVATDADGEIAKAVRPILLK